MTTRMIGRITSEVKDSAGHFTGLVGLRVSLHSPDGLFSFELGAAISSAEGFFEIKDYRRDRSEVGQHRMLELVVHDGVGRELHRFPEMQDEDGELLSKGDFIINDAEARGYLVTLGTGQHRADGRTLPGWGLTQGNRVVLLMDQDAFKRAAELIASAKESVLMSQLFFPVPKVFAADATNEETKLIFDFNAPKPDPRQLPRLPDPKDIRPERLIVDAAARGVPVRVLIHAFEVPLFIKILAGVLIFPFGGTDGIRAVTGGLLDDDLTDTDEDKRYFSESGQAGIKVEAFEQPILSAGVMHAKLVSVDRSHALSIGSPFGQNYVDSHEHAIESPSRGNTSGYPMHDAGFGVTGPAAVDLFHTLKLLWDTATPNDKVPDPEPDRFPRIETPPLPERIDGQCSMQIVRTLTAGRFGENFKDGEKGILEAYLRAIENATDFIYLETQYFTNDAIGEALVKAMNRNTTLQTIVMLNIEPDVPSYPFKQRRLITRIREGIGQPAGDNSRFGVFTRWTHEAGEPRPRIVPVYIHAKAGIVDNNWATVGSANLDGLSLDSSKISDVLNCIVGSFVGRPVFREQRAIEVNGVMFDGIADQPKSEVVDILRRKLWAEHLGYFAADGSLDIGADDLDKDKPHDGAWLGLWSRRAAATLNQLIDNPSLSTNDMARVLPWPDKDTTYKKPREHLTALGIKSFKVAPLKSTRAFDFKTGNWKEGSKAKMDYD